MLHVGFYFGIRVTGGILAVSFYAAIKSKVVIDAKICNVLSLSLFISVPFNSVSSGTCNAVVQADYLALTGGECDGFMQCMRIGDRMIPKFVTTLFSSACS